MTVRLPIPAAHYLRMSTEHQQYSTENQAHSNEQFAQLHGFTITRTYRDSAKIGLWLQRRSGPSGTLGRCDRRQNRPQSHSGV